MGRGSGTFGAAVLGDDLLSQRDIASLVVGSGAPAPQHVRILPSGPGPAHKSRRALRSPRAAALQLPACRGPRSAFPTKHRAQRLQGSQPRTRGGRGACCGHLTACEVARGTAVLAPPAPSPLGWAPARRLGRASAGPVSGRQREVLNPGSACGTREAAGAR